jgi:hypothetical protein
MPSTDFDTVSQEIFNAYTLLVQQHLLTPATIMLMVGVDTMAALDRPAGQSDVQRRDFIRWVTTYLLPESGMACTAAELFGARCAVLPTYARSSPGSRGTPARAVRYILDIGPDQFLNQAATADGTINTHVCVSIGRLAKALTRGIMRFRASILTDPAKTALVATRAAELDAGWHETMRHS